MLVGTLFILVVSRRCKRGFFNLKLLKYTFIDGFGCAAGAAKHGGPRRVREMLRVVEAVLSDFQFNDTQLISRMGNVGFGRL